jgi:hypothetical protein
MPEVITLVGLNVPIFSRACCIPFETDQRQQYLRLEIEEPR